MTRIYSVKAPNRRLPVQVFYNVLNLVSINSWVLFKEINNSKISRSDFIIKLIEGILSLKENSSSSRTIFSSPSTKRKLNDLPSIHCQIKLYNKKP
jgi:hypothetical protein